MELDIEGKIQLGVTDVKLLEAANRAWLLFEGMQVKEIKEILAILNYNITTYCLVIPVLKEPSVTT